MDLKFCTHVGLIIDFQSPTFPFNKHDPIWALHRVAHEAHMDEREREREREQVCVVTMHPPFTLIYHFLSKKTVKPKRGSHPKLYGELIVLYVKGLPTLRNCRAKQHRTNEHQDHRSTNKFLLTDSFTIGCWPKYLIPLKFVYFLHLA